MNYKNLEIKWLAHSSFLIKAGINIYIDPFKIANAYEKADLILITHGHYDHCSVEDIKKILKTNTKIIGPSDILSQTRQIRDIDFEIAEPGKTLVFENVKIECIPAYNLNKSFHPKNEYWLGYILDINGVRVYHSGDTDLIPEMKNIKTNIALLPVGGKFTMNYEEAANAAEIIMPELAIPMHFGTIIGAESDAQNFVRLCTEKGINARILNKE